jgi:hypothetical protein
MKRTLLAILVLAFITLSGFIKESVKYEQIAFDYFVSDVLASDYKEIATINFKGKTEESYEALGTYKFCLKPAEKLGSVMEEVTKGLTRNAKEISLEHIKGLTIHDFGSEATGSKLFVYTALHVADNHYVFITFEKSDDEIIKYVFELSSDGNISRSCEMK